MLKEMFKGMPMPTGRALKPILQMNDATSEVIRVWPSGTAAAQSLGVSPSSISMAANNVKVCLGHRSECAHGFRWRFLKDASKSDQLKYAGLFDEIDEDTVDRDDHETGSDDAEESKDDETQQPLSELLSGHGRLVSVSATARV